MGKNKNFGEDTLSLIPYKDLAQSNEKISNLIKTHPNLAEEIQNLRDAMLQDSEIKNSFDPKNITDFYIAEILHLNKFPYSLGEEITPEISQNNYPFPERFKEAAQGLFKALNDELDKFSDRLYLVTILAGFYQNGIGVKKNASKAIEFHSLTTQYSLAFLNAHIARSYQDYDKNDVEAFKYHKLAADDGLATSQCIVGISYHNGFGVEENFVEAVKYYEKAAKQGMGAAQNNLGFCYKIGQGVEVDPVKAVKFFQLAADQGVKDSQNYLKSYREEGCTDLISAAISGNAKNVKRCIAENCSETGYVNQEWMGKSALTFAAENDDATTVNAFVKTFISFRKSNIDEWINFLPQLRKPEVNKLINDENLNSLLKATSEDMSYFESDTETDETILDDIDETISDRSSPSSSVEDTSRMETKPLASGKDSSRPA